MSPFRPLWSVVVIGVAAGLGGSEWGWSGAIGVAVIGVVLLIVTERWMNSRRG